MYITNSVHQYSYKTMVPSPNGLICHFKSSIFISHMVIHYFYITKVGAFSKRPLENVKKNIYINHLILKQAYFVVVGILSWVATLLFKFASVPMSNVSNVSNISKYLFFEKNWYP